MVISWQWLNEWVDLSGVSAQELAEKLTRASCEVEKIEMRNRALAHVQVAKVTAMSPHPNAKSLQIVTIDLGGSSSSVVCGAQNMHVGNFVAYAPVGTHFDDGMILSSKEIAGVASAGMLCSAKELGVSEDHQGLWILDSYLTDANAPLGKLLVDVLGLYSDTLLHIDNKSITHRNDLWGMLGMAREVAAVMDRPFSNPYDTPWQEARMQSLPSVATSPFTLEIKSDCALSYAGLLMDHVDVEQGSPLWLQYRLYLLGLRSINIIVDISNYVMLELGIPNHIYDRAKLAGNRLEVMELAEPRSFVTLDGQTRDLVVGDVVIADAQEVQIIAGIMGGEASMVESGTKAILLEAAVWDASTVRKSSLRLGLRTDSSTRYEKSLDPHAITLTLLRMSALIEELMPQAVISSPILMAREAQSRPQSITIEQSWVHRRLGLELSYQSMAEILSRLAYHTELTDDGLRVTPPTFRATKSTAIAEDILEEILRVYGFDRIVPQPPHLPVAPNFLADFVQIERRIQDFMVLHAQAFEVMTHPLVGLELLERAHWPAHNEALKMLNSTNVEHDRMRPTLVASLLRALELNSKHSDAFRLFELGRVQEHDPVNFSKECKHLAILYYDYKASPFMQLLDHTQALGRYLNQEISIELEPKAMPLYPEDWFGLHPYERASLSVNGVVCGSVSAIHPLLLKEYKVRGHASLLLLEMSVLPSATERKEFPYKSLSRYPSSRFDSTWILKEEQKTSDLMAVLASVDIPYLQEYSMFDIYQPAESKERHVTMRAIFGSQEATLDAKQVKEAEERVMQAFSEAGYLLKQ